MRPTRWMAALVLAATLLPGPARAALITFATTLSGAAETPPVVTPGTGSSVVTYDTVGNTLRVAITFSGLVGTTTVAHIHCCTALPFTGTAIPATPVPSFPGFPAGVTSGSYDRSFDLDNPASWNPAFITANGGTTARATAALLAGLDTGRAYVNVHSTAFPGGEIAGFLQPVPEPATLGLFLAGLLGLGVAAQRGRSPLRGAR